MKHQVTSGVLCVFAFIFLLLSCKKETVSISEPTTVEALQPMKAEKMVVPFKGTYNTTRELLSPPPIVHVTIEGTGQATHLGLSKFVISSVISFTTPPPFQLSGTSIFYAANGDTFNTTFTGSSIPQPERTFLAIFNHHITGGTGRFQHASGSFTGHHIGHEVNAEGFTTIDGTISY